MMENPYHWLKVNPDLFYGTDRLKMIDETISGLHKGESFAIVGGRRLGKTTLLRRLEKEIVKGSPRLLPVYIDAQAMPGASSSAEALRWVRERVEGSIGLDLSGEDYQFGEWITGAVTRKDCLKLVLLVDEFDAFREYKWCSTFFNNWRALINNTPGVSERLGVVLTGARMLQTLRESPGSPLSNVLTWKYLSLLNEEDTKRLVHEPTGGRFGSDVGESVWRDTGGHPFIIQYLMHHLCESEKEGVEEALEVAGRKFINEHDIVFRQWWFDHLEEHERKVYRVLRRKKNMSVEEVAQELGYPKGTIRQNLKTLSYIGLVRGVKGAYTIAGEIFDKWIEDNDVVEEDGKITPAKITPATHSLHELFDDVEKTIRDFVTAQLREIDELRNLPKMFPDQVGEANKLYREDRGVDQECPLEEVLLWSDFSFPFEIILRFWKHFYNEAFSPQTRSRILGRDQNKAKQRFEERKDVLTRIRNAIRHSRPITDDDRDKARVFCRDILALIHTKDDSDAG